MCFAVCRVHCISKQQFLSWNIAQLITNLCVILLVEAHVSSGCYCVCLWQHGVWHGPESGVLPSGRVRHVRAYGSAGHCTRSTVLTTVLTTVTAASKRCSIMSRVYNECASIFWPCYVMTSSGSNAAEMQCDVIATEMWWRSSFKPVTLLIMSSQSVLWHWLVGS